MALVVDETGIEAAVQVFGDDIAATVRQVGVVLVGKTALHELDHTLATAHSLEEVEEGNMAVGRHDLLIG